MTPTRSVAAAAALILSASVVQADPMRCDLWGYRRMAGLAAATANDALTLTWDGDRNQELRLRFVSPVALNQQRGDQRRLRQQQDDGGCDVIAVAVPH